MRIGINGRCGRCEEVADTGLGEIFGPRLRKSCLLTSSGPKEESSRNLVPCLYRVWLVVVDLVYLT